MPPASPVKLIFIHHSTGENWLNDTDGGLGVALRDNRYFVSDTNYGWGSSMAASRGLPIGSTTDIGDWYTWFRGTNAASYAAALFAESGQNSGYSRLATDPGGENEIIVFKSCFPNSGLGGTASETPPAIDVNPLKGQDSGSATHTVANAKGIYIDLLGYFGAHPEKLFVAVAAPRLCTSRSRRHLLLPGERLTEPQCCRQHRDKDAGRGHCEEVLAGAALDRPGARFSVPLQSVPTDLSRLRLGQGRSRQQAAPDWVELPGGAIGLGPCRRSNRAGGPASRGDSSRRAG